MQDRRLPFEYRSNIIVTEIHGLAQNVNFVSNHGRAHGQRRPPPPLPAGTRAVHLKRRPARSVTYGQPVLLFDLLIDR